MKNNKYFWLPEKVNKDVNILLQTLAEDYPLTDGDGNIRLDFEYCNIPNHVEVRAVGNNFHITYNTLSQAARGTAHAIAGLEINETNSFDTLGVMLDCSRNAVFKVSHLKMWLRRLATMGYNMAMLYTEDTYQLPDEPVFGYLRGPYSMVEIKEIDKYAGTLGIELRACIQVLGHMDRLLEWIIPYRKLADTKESMCIGESETYKLIAKMFAFWSEALSSKRIHIGMDEAWDFGLGFYLKRNGFHDRFELFNKHLTKVNDLCREYGLKPMIWSDMYFRMGNKDALYYETSSVIPEKVKESVPSDVDLVYWDYYQKDVKTYLDMIEIHNSFNNKVIMASGIYSWYKLWYDPYITEATIIPCIEACRIKKIKDFFFTIWGNDGAYCQVESCFAGLCLGAQLSYKGRVDDKYLERIFKTVTNLSYEAVKLGAGTAEIAENSCNEEYIGMLLWDDPLLALEINMIKNKVSGGLDIIKRAYKKGLEKLNSYENDSAVVDFELIKLQMKFIISKIDLRKDLLNSYLNRDLEKLRHLADTVIPGMTALLEHITSLMRKYWMSRYKVVGFESLQLRQAGQAARLQETSLRIHELLNNEVDEIMELEVPQDIKFLRSSDYNSIKTAGL